MKVDIDDIIKLIDREIRWYENHEEVRVISEDAYHEFVEGLKHTKYLIGQIKGELDD